MMLRRSRRIHHYGAGDAVACLSLILVVCLCLFYSAQPVRAAISATGDVRPSDPATWSSSTTGYIGYTGTGAMNITNGSDVIGYYSYVGYSPGSTGEVTVDGPGSTWRNNGELYVGFDGKGTLNITGGTVRNWHGYIGYGYGFDSKGEVTVDGLGSMWINGGNLIVGKYSSSSLKITDSGLVSVRGTLTIDYDANGDGFINMTTGGMLALYGDADDSLFDFLGLIDGTDAIRYWDDSISNWADITGATYGQDYTLSYLTEGDLTGYTRLTVTAVPEPATLSLLVLGGMAMLRRKRSASVA